MNVVKGECVDSQSTHPDKSKLKKPKQFPRYGNTSQYCPYNIKKLVGFFLWSHPPLTVGGKMAVLHTKNGVYNQTTVRVPSEVFDASRRLKLNHSEILTSALRTEIKKRQTETQ